jgi:hypothetical protein
VGRRQRQFFSVDAVDEVTPGREAAVAVRTFTQGQTFTGNVSDGSLSGMSGSRFNLLEYQRNAVSATASITLNERSITGWVDLYQWEDENQMPHIASIGINANVTLPPPPDAAMCRRASLPQPEEN